MTARTLAITAILMLAACKGPAEKAGEEKDQQAANLAGVPYDGSGPNEAIGRAQDHAANAAKDAAHAKAKALSRQGDEIRDRAGVEAERLEQQAKALRAQADKQADALDDQAKQVKDAVAKP